MKVAKLVIGIISFVLAMFIMFQSCAAGLSNAMEENGELGGSAGFILAVFAIVAGIIAIVTRNHNGKGAFVAAAFYIVGGLIGLAMAGSYSDLRIWGVIAIVFGVVFIVGTILAKKKERLY